jgi:ABC-2 type transport system ATP-binding protein
VERVEADGLRVTLTLDGATAGEVVARLAGAVPLRDLSVLEPEIEDVVARLYRG